MELQDLVDSALLGFFVPEDIEAYNRRRQALEDAYHLAKDQADIEAAKARLVKDAAKAAADAEEEQALEDAYSLGKDQADIEADKARLAKAAADFIRPAGTT